MCNKLCCRHLSDLVLPGVGLVSVYVLFSLICLVQLNVQQFPVAACEDTYQLG